MKKIIYLACCLFALQITAAAQSKKTELLDLIKTLAADSAATTETVAWPKTTTVKWATVLPKKEGKDFTKAGVANVLVKGKSIKCQGMNDDGGPCTWGVNLTGTKAGYKSFAIAADNLHIENDIDMIDYFFGKNKIKARLIKKDIESSLFWNYTYKLQMPGKKDLWMTINYECQTSNAAQAQNSGFTDLFYLSFYGSESDLQAAN